MAEQERDPVAIAEERIEVARRNRAKALDLSNLGLTAVPDAIDSLTALTELSLLGNQITALPNGVCNLIALNQLDLSENRLTALPDAIGNLTALTQLDLSSNQLTALPDAIGNLTVLTMLQPYNNRLTVLPDAIGNLTALITLYLFNNRLTVLPNAIGNLTALTRLDLAGNRLVAIPNTIGNLITLNELDLSDNRLTTIPDTIRNLTGLGRFFLHRNPSLLTPPEVLGPTFRQVASGEAAPKLPTQILDYYFRLRRHGRALNEAKLILVGQGGVGKTSLVKRLVPDLGAFDPNESKTHGININRWPVCPSGTDSVTLNVWDFGGQEIMHATHQFFLTERSLYLLVLDGRQGQEDAEAEYWLKLIASFGGGSPVIVVMNKVAEHPFDLNRRALQDKYPNVIKGFVHTDCKEGVGVDELKQAVCRELNALPHWRYLFPAEWFAIKDHLSEMKGNFISYKEFQQICADLGEANEDDQDALAGYLHDLGIALNYKDDARLSDQHVLNPRWITEGIYTVLNAPRLEAQRGALHPGDLAGILDKRTYPRHMHRFLLDLMKKFDLCFPVPDEADRYLVPELLGKEEPEETRRFDPAKCLNFEYRYVVLPEGLLPRFIARTYRYSQGKPRWRTGVVLEFDGNEALIKADPHDTKRVTINVSGPPDRQRGMLTLIRYEFDRIHADFKANPPEAFVPIPGHPEVALPYRDLVVREEKRRETVEVVVGNDVLDQPVSALLNGVDVPAARRRDDRMRADRVRVFGSYSHKDETHLATLRGHLIMLVQEGLIDLWDDRQLRPGDDWAGGIDQNLNTADVILLLVSEHFLASRYCMDVEVPRALERLTAGEAVVIPVRLDGADLTGRPFMTRQALPTDAKPILSAADWPNPNEGWRNVAAGIRAAVERRAAEKGRGR